MAEESTLVAFRNLAEGFDAFAGAMQRAGASLSSAAARFREAFDPAVTPDRRKARRLARRFGGRFVVERWKGRRLYVLTGAAATRAIEAARGRGAW